MTDGALSRLGITPKDEWLNDCRSHIEAIGSSNGNGETTDDQILHEILHTDLRFVVRGLSMDMTETAASVLLREVVRASMSENDDGLHKASLPASFRIMVQIEELLDVSINAESRLKYGPSEIHEPAVGTQNSRCLKMIISDGFAELDDIGPLVAMECLPIRNLSSHSRAGIKMLLKGPIDVRYGVLNLHEGCVVVLGGCVEALLQVQKKAHEQAKKAACFGQDATIRALVMPHNDIGNDDAEEEGEVESSDLQPTNGTGTNQSSPSFFSPNNNMGPSNANVGMTETRRISARPLASIQNGTESGHSTHNPLLLNNRNLNADNSSEENASRPDAATNSFARSVATERKNPYTNTLSTGMQPTRRIPNRSTPVEATAITSTENSNRTSNTSSMTQNPYASSEINFNTSFQNQSTITSVREKENESADDQNDPGEIDIGTSLSPIMKISSPALQRNKQQNNGSLISTFLSETALSVPLSFREFVLKLEDFRKGANEYKKFETKTFIIPAKMKVCNFYSQMIDPIYEGYNLNMYTYIFVGIPKSI